jgi:hypothetical protein
MENKTCGICKEERRIDKSDASERYGSLTIHYEAGQKKARETIVICQSCLFKLNELATQKVL